MDVNFNINSYVKVKLTESGINILRMQYEELAIGAISGIDFEASLASKIDKDGYYKRQMHSLMLDFGQYMLVGSAIPFETDIILTDCEEVKQ